MRFGNAFGQLRTIATSLLQREGEISHDIVLKLLSHDFNCVNGRQHEEFVEREQAFADNFDLGRAQRPSLCWYLLMLGCRESIPFAFSSNFGGQFFFIIAFK